jgi:hypothetical protein
MTSVDGLSHLVLKVTISQRSSVFVYSLHTHKASRFGQDFS